MYDMDPPGVFVSDRVLEHKEGMDRVQRVLRALGRDAYEVVSDLALPAMLERPEWKATVGKAGSRAAVHDPNLFFTLFRFDDGESALRSQIAEANPGADVSKIHPSMLGYHHFTWFNSDQASDDIKPCPQHVCRPAWRLHTGAGCAHRCAYCDLVGFMNVGLNMRDYLEQLDGLVTANPWQLTYLLDDISDVLILEPELGAMAEVIDYFSGKEDRYLIIHTKSANVDFLESLEHAGHTIPCWSLSAHTQSTQLEAVAGTTEERIDAAQRCQAWGYPVRFKFKPIIPVRDWRDEARDMIRLMFERTRPDNLSMTVMMWMAFDELAACIDLDTLDSAFVDAARREEKEQKELPKNRPFPHNARRAVYEFYLAEIRAHDPDVPVTISTESLAMWHELGSALGVSPHDYTCGCGPQAVPGLSRLPESPWRLACPRRRV